MELNITRQISTLRALARINRFISESAKARHDSLISQHAASCAESFEDQARKLEVKEAANDAAFLFSLCIMLLVLSTIAIFH